MVSTRWKETRVGKEEEAPVSVEENNKGLMRRFVEEVLNQGNLDAIDELLAPDYVDHGVPQGNYAGREGLKRSIAKQLAASSDLHFHIEEQIAEGDKVITWIIGSGTHDRERFLGLVPTGERMTMEFITISRVVDGKIVEDRGVRDASAVWQQRLQRERIERERVEQELQVARSIQQASLPKEVPAPEGWQITPFYQPAREVGGDFYDFFEFGDGRVGVVVGDATGKGVPAALVMASARSMLRAVAQASESPGDVLERINDPLVTDIPPNMFVTCFYAILEPKSGRLLYANAGHNLPYCRRHEDVATDLEARGMPLGLMPGMRYEEKETVLVSGDCELFYTDGLIEAHNPQGEMFGTPRLRSLLSERFESGRGMSASLLDELERFTGEGWEQEDDVTLLTLERFPTRR